ncbi:hypothetical protein SAMN05443549_10993 [Flavobacterium fluvii]|uniref:Por secretion system C-terminal sorting domain-containing protein n=1 Tax=Flavobacterium fluvii TaxID=468056 RepID=A0A1M5P7J4_9FLAO|nr:hypothetical protein [Flavobacterium fluvii]SHG97722.1 hypothetical protein SAMN05443549_10993 [Flavobacterium fluvii]
MKRFTLPGFLNLFTPKDLIFETSEESSFKFDFSKDDLKENGYSNRSSSGRGIGSLILLFMLFLFSNFLSAQTIVPPPTIVIDGKANEWSYNSSVVHFQDPFGNGTIDNQFTEGSKDFLFANAQVWADGQTKAKNDIANGAAGLVNTVSYYDQATNSIKTLTGGNYLVFAGDRTSNNGDAQIGFWFYQNGTGPVEINGNKIFDPEHSRGDILVLADFTGGGRLGTVKVYRWIGGGDVTDESSSIVPNTNGNLETTNIASIVAENNTAGEPIPEGWDFLSKRVPKLYEQNEFYEGFVDLSALGDNVNKCFSTVLLETRSSQSVTASLDDFIGGKLAGVPLVTVDSANILCVGQSATITATPSPGSPGDYTYLWSPGGQTTQSITVTTAGTYTVTAYNKDGCPTAPASGTVTATPSIPIVVNCSPDVSKSACDYASQNALDTAFAAWVAGFTASGGNGTLVPSGLLNLKAPNLCTGGSVTVNFSVTDACAKQASCTATFSINKGEAVAVTGPASINKAVCDYTDQAGLTAAYNAWLAEFKITNAGCNATGDFLTTPPTVDFCAGADITLTYRAADACTNASVTRTFKVTKADAVAVAGPASIDKKVCDYTNQAGLTAAYNAWLAEFKITNAGCNATGGFLSTPPTVDFCAGADITLTYRAADACTNASVTRTFKVTKADAVAVAGPASIDKKVCDYTNQAGLTAAYNAWLAEFKITNTGCNATGGFLTTPPATVDFCAGADITLTYRAVDACTNASVTRTFKVTKADAVAVAGPASINKAVCEYTDQAGLTAAYNAWLAEFKITNAGCNATGGFLSTPPTVDFCAGADITLTYKANDACTNASVTRTFKVTKAAAVDVTGPMNISKTSCDYAIQDDVNTAFGIWLSEFKTVNAGCNGIAKMNPATPQAPILCEGGSVTVTYSIEDNCTQDSVSATFSIEAAEKLIVSYPGDVVVKCDQNKEELFAQWITGFTYTGGCSNAVVTNLAQYSLPAAGVPLLVEYVVTDNCQTASHKATFLIDFCDALCTYTQGYYGNAGGKSCAGEENGTLYSTKGLIAKALSSYPLNAEPIPSNMMRIGLPGKSVLLSNTTADINAIIEVLPGGGSSYVLSNGNPHISALTAATYLKKGNINNTLLAQTITLGLNLGINGKLGNFVLQSGKLATAAPLGGCGSNIPMPRSCSYDIYTPTINEYKYFDIPAFVNGKTVQQLFEMANKALGGEALPAGVTLSALANAVDVINNAFDGCRISMGYNQTPLTCVEERAAFIVNPVPIVSQATVTYKFSYSSPVKIEVRSTVGGALLFTYNDPTPSSLNKEVLVPYNFTASGYYFITVITNIGSTTKQVIKN